MMSYWTIWYMLTEIQRKRNGYRQEMTEYFMKYVGHEYDRINRPS